MAGLQPTAAARPIAQRVYLLAGIFGLALVAAFGFPRLDQALNPGATQPGLISFLGVGLAALALTAVLLFVGLRGFLPKTAVFIAAAFGYNALLILVKFGLGPLALYATSRGQGFWVLSDLGGYLAFPGLAAITAILYGGAFFLLFGLTFLFNHLIHGHVDPLPLLMPSAAAALPVGVFLLCLLYSEGLRGRMSLAGIRSARA